VSRRSGDSLGTAHEDYAVALDGDGTISDDIQFVHARTAAQAFG
jgi:hypothetical protein